MRKKPFTIIRNSAIKSDLNLISKFMLSEAIKKRKFISVPVAEEEVTWFPELSQGGFFNVFLVTFNPRRGTLALFKGCPDWLSELKTIAFQGSVFDGGEK